MNLRLILLFGLLLIKVVCHAQRELVKISPEKPKIGDTVNIYFDDKSIELPVTLVFSYSNFFEMPNNLELKQKEGRWHTSFVVPRYAKYASFYLKQGDKIFKPEERRHYELIFYQDNKPVLDTYLYKSYSLATQMGKDADSLKIKTNKLIENELSLYPNNYAAKLRLLANKMADDKEGAAKYLEEGLAIIEKKLAEDPTRIANINQVTMGYLIMGQNARIASLKDRLVKNYPNTEVAFEFIYEEAYKLKNEAERIKKLEQLLAYNFGGESSSYAGIHESLFEYYAGIKNEGKALFHANGFVSVDNPWQPKYLKEAALTLANNNLGLETAKKYAEQALSRVEDYPYGVVRYFPEYGYIPGYVGNKPALVALQKGEILSILGKIYTLQGRFQEAERYLKEARTYSNSLLLNQNLAFLYEQTKKPELAFEAYRQMVLNMPVDSTVLGKFKNSYLAKTGSIKGYEYELERVIAEWEQNTLPALKASKVNFKAPLFKEVYDMERKLVDPKVLENKVVIVDFWATWCVPCIEGFPFLQKVYDQFKNRKDVVFMVMNSGSKNTIDDAIAWAKQNKFTFPIYYNDRSLANAFDINTIPSTFVIDKQGNVRYKRVGFEGPIMQAKLALEIKDVLKD